MHWALTPSISPQPMENFPVALLSGFSVYTTFRLPLAEKWLKAHIQRLADNAQTIGLNWPYTQDWLFEQIEQCFQPDKPVLRLAAFADIAGYGDFFKPGALETRLVLSARSAPPMLTRSLRLKTIEYERPLATVKLGAIPEPIVFKRQAIANGFDDVLFFNRHGHITEASTANCFLIDASGALLTAEPERDGCLPGITRQQVLEVAEAKDIPVHTKAPVSCKVIHSITGAFLTNAAQGLIPVIQIDGNPLPWPEAGQQLFATLQESLREMV